MSLIIILYLYITTADSNGSFYDGCADRDFASILKYFFSYTIALESSKHIVSLTYSCFFLLFSLSQPPVGPSVSSTSFASFVSTSLQTITYHRRLFKETSLHLTMAKIKEKLTEWVLNDSVIICQNDYALSKCSAIFSRKTNLKAGTNCFLFQPFDQVVPLHQLLAFLIHPITQTSVPDTAQRKQER